jgi:phage replication-related protein YjqB (UPF0714/DUF867 family)
LVVACHGDVVDGETSELARERQRDATVTAEAVVEITLE